MDAPLVAWAINALMGDPSVARAYAAILAEKVREEQAQKDKSHLVIDGMGMGGMPEVQP